VPGVESEYLSLTRDYDTIQASFKDLLTKSESAKVAENLESRQIGEQFRVLDAPRVPLRPISPARALISGGGLAGGLLLGLALVVLLEFKDGSLKNELDVTLVLQLPVVAVVPRLLTGEERARIVRRRWMVTAAGGMLTVAACYTVWAMRLWQFAV